jgi:acyl-[acyl-carrier-protein]-phospholipid O-acyltransferase/long-chain-fatty-acid--[acyl-carrier-protein] ligase
MAACFILLGILEPTIARVAVLIGLAGLSAGFYIVPLQALLQKLSPDGERGRFLGTANALSFTASSLGAGLYWALSGAMGVAPNRVFLACAVLAILGTAVGTVQLRRLLAARAEAALAAEPLD